MKTSQQAFLLTETLSGRSLLLWFTLRIKGKLYSILFKHTEWMIDSFYVQLPVKRWHLVFFFFYDFRDTMTVCLFTLWIWQMKLLLRIGLPKWWCFLTSLRWYVFPYRQFWLCLPRFSDITPWGFCLHTNHNFTLAAKCQQCLSIHPLNPHRLWPPKEKATERTDRLKFLRK